MMIRDFALAVCTDFPVVKKLFQIQNMMQMAIPMELKMANHV